MRTLALLALVLAIAAWATRPGPEAFDAMLRAAIAEKVATTDVDASGDAVATLALVGCKLRPGDCFQALRATLDVTFDRGLFTTRATVRGLTEATCTGAFTRFFCREDLLAR